MTFARTTIASKASRKKWLRGSSILAAAVVLATVPLAERAEARPGINAANTHSIAPGVLRGPVSVQQAPLDVRGEAISIPRVPPVNPVTQPVLPNVHANHVAPQVQPDVTLAPAPVVPSVPVNRQGTQTEPNQQGVLSSNSLAATSANNPGVSVEAFATFDDTKVDFLPSAGGDLVEVFASSAIIDWTTFTAGAAGTEVTFLGAGRNLDFTSDLSDYTVLNRIFTPGFDSSIRIDGNVTSTVLGGAATGGNIWFYSPGGLVIGSDAVFNIGSLLLTTSAPDPTDVGNASFDVNFLGTPNTASVIRIEDGASITAGNNNSYVAMVAPRIEQGGTVNVNGSTAYVAAEEATMTINNGLFDISVNVGSDDPNGIVHTGTSGGPSSTGILDEQAIYMVAVPKNTAINMLVGGSVGYNGASSATVENGKIILTTGNRVEREERNVFVPDGLGGFTVQQVSSNFVDTSIDGGAAGSITLEGVTFLSSTEVFAEDTITLQAGVSDPDDGISALNVGIADPGGPFIAPIDLDLTAGNAVNMNVTRDGTIFVSGSLSLSAGDGEGNGGDIAINLDQTGALSAPTGGLFVGGDLTVSSAAQGLDDFFTVRNNGGTGIGQDAVAGDISIDISADATLDVGGNFIVSATGQGGKGEEQNGSSTGGDVTLNLSSGALNIGGVTTISSGGIQAQQSKIGGSGPGRIGNSSTAGNVAINLSGGSATLGQVTVSAGAIASLGSDETVAQNNNATAGAIDVNVTGGSHSATGLFIANDTRAAESFDGSPNSFPGQANGAPVTISVANADTSLTVNGQIFVNATAQGNTNDLAGDLVRISVTDTGNAPGSGLTVTDLISINTQASVGSAGEVSKGGSVGIFADNGQFAAGTLIVSADALGSEFAVLGDVTGTGFEGGDVTISATNGGAISVTNDANIQATGIGFVNSAQSEGGIGQGGIINVLADDGAINVGGLLTLNASGFAVAGVDANGNAGQGIGGTVRVTVQGAGGSMSLGDVSASTNGAFTILGEGFLSIFDGAGSSGQGGLTEFNILGGTFSANNVTMAANGTGGEGGESLTSSGEGGAGTGGTVTVNLDGGSATVSNLTVAANGIGGRGAFGGANNGTTPGVGGAATGGTATFNANSGSLAVTNTLRVEATGNTDAGGGEGGDGAGVAGGAGGASTGGDATFNLDGTASISATDLVVSTQALGGAGGDSIATFDFATFAPIPDAGGGRGGDATGGNATFNDVAGDLSFTAVTVNAGGEGGDGGASIGQTTSDSAADGGAGGSGFGGSALVSLNQDDGISKSYTVLSQGEGGTGGLGATGGDGGRGQGGNAELAVNNVAVNFNQVLIDTGGTGGSAGFNDGPNPADGGNGGGAVGGVSTLLVNGTNANFSAGGLVEVRSGAVGADGGDATAAFNDIDIGGDGGDGGFATGGVAVIHVTDGATFTLDADSTVINADTTGGTGGSGGGHFGGGTAGAGGAGGDAFGGTVQVLATSGADVTLQSTSVAFALSSTGTGGRGGNGGDILGAAGTAGTGGVGGTGTGGTPMLMARGGTITSGDVELFALGLGGAGGTGGTSGGVIVGASGAGGDGAGGTPQVQILDGSPGIITLGDLLINATGTGGSGATTGQGLGGQVYIEDFSVDSLGLITLGNVNVNATGDAGTNAGLFALSSARGPITIDGNLIANVAGDITMGLRDSGQVAVTGDVNLNADQDIVISHRDNPDIDSLSAGGNFTATAGRNYRATAFTLVNSVTGDVNITAETIEYDDIAADGLVALTATNGSINGFATGTITAASVVDAITLNATQDVNFGNLVTQQGNIVVNATAGNITGTSATSAQFVTMDAPGTIAVQSITTVTPVLGSVNLNGGAIDIGTLSATGIVNANALVGNLAIDDLDSAASANLDAAGSIVLGTADVTGISAIAGGNLTLGSLTTTAASGADILSAGGTVTYTNISSGRVLDIAGSDIVGGDAVAVGSALYDATGSINVGDVTTMGVSNVTMTAATGDLTTGAVNSRIVTLEATAGSANIGSVNSSSSTNVTTGADLTIGDVQAGRNLALTIGGNLVAGNLNSDTTSPGMTLSVGGDADIASATTDGLLDLNITGALTGGAFSGAGVVTLDAASIDVALVESINQAVTVTASAGDASVGTANSNFNTTITGDNVTLDNGTIGGNLTVLSTTGDITGGGTITVAGTADLNANANMAIGSLEANAISLTSGGDMLFDALTSPNAITLQASSGAIGANTPGMGNITSGGLVDLTALTMAVGDITSASGITANATGGDASFGTLDAATDIVIEAAGTPTIANAISGGDTSVTGSSVTFNSGTIGGDLTLDATDGDIDGNGSISVSGAIDFSATGNVGFGSLEALGGNFVITSDGDITFTSATSTDLIDFTAAGTVQGGGLTAPNSVSVTGNSIILGSVESDQIALTSSNDILFDAITSPNAISLTAMNGRIGENTAGMGNIDSGGAVTLLAQEIDINEVLAGGDLTATTTIGGLTIDNSIVTGNITLNAQGNILIDHAEATGNLNATGQANLTTGLNSIITGGDIIIVMPFGIVNLGNSSAGGLVNVIAEQIDFVNLDAGSTVTLQVADQTGGSVTNGNGNITGTNVTAGPGASLFSTSFGSINIGGNAVIGGSLDADAAFDLFINSLTTQAGGFTGTAGGAISFNSINSGDFVDLDANDILGNGPIDAAGEVVATGVNSVTINAAVTSGDQVVVEALDGPVNLANVDAVGSVAIAGTEVAAGNLTSTGAVASINVDSTTGDIVIQNATGTHEISLDAAGSITFNNVDAADDVFLTAGGNITGQDIVAANNGAIITGAVIALDDIQSTGLVRITGDSIAVGDVNAALIDFTSASDILFDLLQSPNAITLTAANGIVGINNGPGDIESDDDVTIVAQAIDINDVTAGGSVSANATAGDATFGLVDAAGSVSIEALDTASLAGLTSGADASIAGAALAVDGGTIGGNLALNARGSDLDASGTFTVGGAIDLDAFGDITFGSLDAQGGNFTADAGGSISFDDANASGDINFTAQDAIVGQTVTTDENANLTAGAGGIDLAVLNASNSNVLATGGPVVIDDAQGQLVVEGTSVTVGASGDLDVAATATAGDVDLQVAGVLTAVGTATGDVSLVSLGADAIINGASGQNVALSAGGDLEVQGSVDAAAALNVDAGGLFTLDASAVGQTATVNASDVNITTDGRLGDATVTGLITINGADDVYLGGAGGNGAVFEIDNAEFSRIHSGGDVVITVAGFGQTGGGGGALPSITVDTLDALAGDGSSATGQNIGQDGGLVLQSEGDINVIGDANISNATLDTAFILEAVNLVRVNSAIGGLFVLDGNNGLAGTIEVTAQDFMAVTDQAFADIPGLTLTEIDERLANSDGVDRPDGVIRADTLDIDTTASQVFIQNTVAGTDFDDRRGFDVNNLFLSDSGGTIQPIVINGVIGGVTGIDTIPLANISSSFDTASTINGCLIADPNSCIVIIDPIDNFPDASSTGLEDTRDLIEEGLEPEEGEGAAEGDVLVGIIDLQPTSDFGTDPLIDEPVTGAGNEDLWVDPECPPGSDPEVCSLEPAE